LWERKQHAIIKIRTAQNAREVHKTSAFEKSITNKLLAFW
jgi:hypothetical protein